MDKPQLSSINTADGLSLQGYCWPTDDAVAVVVMVHGLGDHGRRYRRLGEQLNQHHMIAFSYDQRGHGQSATTLGNFSDAGWLGMVADLQQVLTQLKLEHPDIPVILFGHSMGSMLAHHLITEHPELVDGVILSGSPGFASVIQTWLLLAVTRFERWRKGPNNQSPVIQFLLFDAANKAFETEGPTGFEWLSRDQREVSIYVDDPACGFVPTTGSTFDWFNAFRHAADIKAVEHIPKDLPIYLFSGTADPLHNNLKNIQRQLTTYREAGLEIQTRYYPDGRHEMLNEINRDQVMADLIDWIEKLIPTIEG